MAKSLKSLTDNLRNEYVEKLENLLSTDCNVLKTGTGTLYIEALDEEGNEKWVKISVIIPKASEEDGTDGYSLAEEYKLSCEEKLAKAKEKEEAKAKKIAKDKAKRKKDEATE